MSTTRQVLSWASRTPDFQRAEEAKDAVSAWLSKRSRAYRIGKAGYGARKYWQRASNIRKLLDEETRSEGALKLSKDAIKTILKKVLPGASLHPATALFFPYFDVLTTAIVAIEKAERLDQQLKKQIADVYQAAKELDREAEKAMYRFRKDGELFVGLRDEFNVHLIAAKMTTSIWESLTKEQREKWLRANATTYLTLLFGIWRHHNRCESALDELLATVGGLRLNVSLMRAASDAIDEKIDSLQAKPGIGSIVGSLNAIEDALEADSRGLARRGDALKPVLQRADALDSLADEWASTLDTWSVALASEDLARLLRQ